MKASKLIKELQQSVRSNGDCEVEVTTPTTVPGMEGSPMIVWLTRRIERVDFYIEQQVVYNPDWDMVKLKGGKTPKVVIAAQGD
jgi:hypothetical protein